MRISANHPSSFWMVATSQYVFQSSLRELPSSESARSPRTPAGVVQNQSDLWNDPQLAHRGFFQWLDHTECGPMPYDGLQFLLSKSHGALRMARGQRTSH